MLPPQYRAEYKSETTSHFLPEYDLGVPDLLRSSAATQEWFIRILTQGAPEEGRPIDWALAKEWLSRYRETATALDGALALYGADLPENVLLNLQAMKRHHIFANADLVLQTGVLNPREMQLTSLIEQLSNPSLTVERRQRLQILMRRSIVIMVKQTIPGPPYTDTMCKLHEQHCLGLGYRIPYCSAVVTPVEAGPFAAVVLATTGRNAVKRK